MFRNGCKCSTRSSGEDRVQSKRRIGMLPKFLKDESGATAIEYGLICSLIVIAILAALQAFANGTTAMYDLIAASMS